MRISLTTNSQYQKTKNNYAQKPAFGKIQTIEIPKKASYYGTSKNLFRKYDIWSKSVLKTIEKSKLMEFLAKYPTRIKLTCGTRNPGIFFIPSSMLLQRYAGAVLEITYDVNEKCGKTTTHTIDIKSDISPESKDIKEFAGLPFEYDYRESFFPEEPLLAPIMTCEIASVMSLQKKIADNPDLEQTLLNAESYINQHATEEYKQQAVQNLTEFLSQEKDPDLSLSNKEITERINNMKHEDSGPEWWRNMSEEERNKWIKEASSKDKLEYFREYFAEVWKKHPEDMAFIQKVCRGTTLEELKNRLMMIEKSPVDNISEITTKATFWSKLKNRFFNKK